MEPASTLDLSASVGEGSKLSHRVWIEDNVKRDGGGRFSKIAALNSKVDKLKAELLALQAKQDQELVDEFGPDILTTPFQQYLLAVPKSQQKETYDRVFSMMGRQITEQGVYTSQISEVEDEITRRTGAVSHSGELLHYGVPGMKWGIRRRNPSGSGSGDTSSSQKKVDLSEDFVKTAALRSKSSASLSNTEMRALIERIELERRYNDVTTPKAPTRVTLPPSRKAKVAKFVTDTMVDIGKTEIKRVARAQAAISVEKALKDAGQKKLARRITPGGGKKKNKPKPPNDKN